MDSEIESNGSLQKRLICPLQRTFLLSREKKKCLKMLEGEWWWWHVDQVGSKRYTLQESIIAV